MSTSKRRKPEKAPQNCFKRGNVWWAEIIVSGVRHRQSLRTDDAREAARRVAHLRQEITRKAVGVEGERSWKSAVVMWMEHGLDGVKPSVTQRYLSSIRNFDTLFSGLLLPAIKTKDVADWVRWRRDRGQMPRGGSEIDTGKKPVSNATIRRDLTALSRLMSFCCSIGWRDDNPVRAYDRSIIREKREPQRPPSIQEIDDAIKEASPPMAGILKLLYQTGMRLNEAVHLERKQIDPDRQQILLTRTKSSHPRALSWKTPGGNATDAIMAGADEGILYPSSDTGEAFRNFSSNHSQLMRRLVRMNPEYRRFNVHSLRHAFAIRWLKNGGSLYRLSRHLGHSSVKVTEHNYLGYLTVEEQEIVQMQTDV